MEKRAKISICVIRMQKKKKKDANSSLHPSLFLPHKTENVRHMKYSHLFQLMISMHIF